MRRALIALAVLALAAGYAGADPTNLSNGALIIHHPTDLVFTDTVDWALEYPTHAITSEAEQNPRIDLDANEGADEVGAVWYLIAAFEEDKEWCGVSFGLGAFEINCFYVAENGACLAGHLEIPVGDWPGPNTGTSVVATTTQWAGNYQAVYWFGGYSYEAGYVPLGINPDMGSIAFGNCEQPAIEYEVPQDATPSRLGVLGIFQDGTKAYVGGDPAPDTFACCAGDGTCSILTEAVCDAAMGTWYDGVICDPKPCEEICCYANATCAASQTEAACLASSGLWVPEEDNDCDAYTCPTAYACCSADAQTCTVVAEFACIADGGIWHSGFTACDPSPCREICCYQTGGGDYCHDNMLEVDCLAVEGGATWHPEGDNDCETFTCPTPATDTKSWGEIKTLYK